MKKDQTPSFDLSSLVRTKREAADCLNNLDNLISSLFNVKVNIIKKMAAFFSYQEKESLVLFCRQNDIDLKNPIKLQKFLISLKEKIEALPVVTLYLAFDPSEEVIKNISDWFVSNLKKEVLLDIVVDRKLAGGAAVAFGGIYKDFSLGKLLEEKFASGEPSFF